MQQIILSGSQILLSIWEIWICYQFLYFMILDENDVSKREKIMMWYNIIIVGSVVGINRLNAFFSSPILLFEIVTTTFFLRKNKDKIIVTASVIILMVMIAVIDMSIALLSFEFLGEDFYSVVYVFAMTWHKVIIFLISRGIVYLCVYILKYKIENIHEVVEQCKYIILGMGIVLCVLLLRYQWMLDGMVNGNVHRKGVSTSVSLVYSTILVVLVGILMAKYYYMKQEKEAILLREQLLEERYLEILKNQQMVHDMKNHFLLLQKYEKDRRWDELHNYLAEINKGMLTEITRVWTGNTIVDTVLSSKKVQAEKLGIQVVIETEMITVFPFTNQESISLFGNLLDNAIEACERMEGLHKWIFVDIQKKNQLLYIQVENSMEGVIKEKNGKLISEKKEKGVHGYGLKNIHQVVNKYDGVYAYEIKEGRFLTVITFFSNEYMT